MRYQYLDGNGNKYLIVKNEQITLEYFPMEPSLSSSGIYDGGEYVKKDLEASQFEQLQDLIENAQSHTSDHIPDRVKGSGQIIITRQKDSEKFILRLNSEYLEEIESFLSKIIKD